jgi:predicted SPOUT superfamily RNA methylase MTH1
LIISTAKNANPFTKITDKIADHWSRAEHILIAFGAPARGLHEIAKDENLRLEDVSDFIVNTIPQQGTATVRTEEALLATLAIFNLKFKPEKTNKLDFL